MLTQILFIHLTANPDAVVYWTSHGNATVNSSSDYLSILPSNCPLAQSTARFTARAQMGKNDCPLNELGSATVATKRLVLATNGVTFSHHYVIMAHARRATLLVVDEAQQARGAEELVLHALLKHAAPMLMVGDTAQPDKPAQDKTVQAWGAEARDKLKPGLFLPFTFRAPTQFEEEYQGLFESDLPFLEAALQFLAQQPLQPYNKAQSLALNRRPFPELLLDRCFRHAAIMALFHGALFAQEAIRG
jgi:hypothetical protein